MEKVVVSVGGSILIPDDNDPAFIKQLAGVLKDVSKSVRLVIVCGGGRIARYYTNTGKELGGSTYQRDIMGIGATRLNAELLRIALGDSAYGSVPDTVDEAVSASSNGKIVVMGGTEPGHTTDAVAAMVAGKIGCRRLVNATSVDAVYSDDPRKNRDAERFTNLTIAELSNIVYAEHDAGKSSVFDPLGVKLAMRDRIDLMIVNGRDLPEMRNAILGKRIKGTLVSSR
jgi:uridylate kinase